MKYLVVLTINVLIFLFSTNQLHASIIYVDKNATGANTGTSWSFIESYKV